MDSQELDDILRNVLKRFEGMKINNETLSYIETDINDAVRRLNPSFKDNFHIQPVFKDSKITFKTHYLN